MAYTLIILPMVPLPLYHTLSNHTTEPNTKLFWKWENHHAGIRAQEEELNPLITDAPASMWHMQHIKEIYHVVFFSTFYGFMFYINLWNVFL